MTERTREIEDEKDFRAKVSQRAYALWLEQGQVHGYDVHHWHQAQREITQALGGQPEALEVSPPKAVGQRRRQ
jgi:hypothetical protein